MRAAAIRTRVAGEARATPTLLDRLLRDMRACDGKSHREHEKCLALQVLRPRLFPGIAAAETWRLFTVAERDGRAAPGRELRAQEPPRATFPLWAAGAVKVGELRLPRAPAAGA